MMLPSRAIPSAVKARSIVRSITQSLKNQPMSQQQRIQRFPVSGVLILNKPLGLSSNAALQRVRYLLRAKKGGHTGALDPLATGVLPLCFGEATKFSQYLLDAEKAYESEFKLGVSTSSGDVDGEITAETDASHLDRKQLEQALQAFVGPIDQVPPMHSALKRNGQPLYKLARQGITVEREPRRVHIKQLTLESFTPGPVALARVSVHCSKGTYIRSLAHDLGEALGVGGHVAQLHRTVAGPFVAQQMQTIENLEVAMAAGPYSTAAAESLLLPVDAGIGHIPLLEIDPEQAAALQLGQKISHSGQMRNGPVRVMLRGAFLGLGDIEGETLQPKRLLVQTTPKSDSPVL